MTDLDLVFLKETPWSEMWPLVGPALKQTLQMVSAVLVIALVVGTPLALALHNTGPRGLFPQSAVHYTLGAIVNVGRSIPFLILMAALIPVTRPSPARPSAWPGPSCRCRWGPSRTTRG